LDVERAAMIALKMTWVLKKVTKEAMNDSSRR